MRRFAFVLILMSVLTWQAFAEEPTANEPSLMECTLYTKPYTSNKHGAYALPEGVKWKVLDRYVGRTEDGATIVDDRLTLILDDESNRFWPMIAKMSLEEAESLQQQLTAGIEKKRAEMATH